MCAMIVNGKICALFENEKDAEGTIERYVSEYGVEPELKEFWE